MELAPGIHTSLRALLHQHISRQRLPDSHDRLICASDETTQQAEMEVKPNHSWTVLRVPSRIAFRLINSNLSKGLTLANSRTRLLTFFPPPPRCSQDLFRSLHTITQPTFNILNCRVIYPAIILARLIEIK